MMLQHMYSNEILGSLDSIKFQKSEITARNDCMKYIKVTFMWSAINRSIFKCLYRSKTMALIVLLKKKNWLFKRSLN